MEISDIEKNYPVINETSRDTMKLFGPRFTNRPGGHIDTDISAVACVAGLQILRRMVPGLPAMPTGEMVLYPGRAEELEFLGRFTVGVCEGLDLDPKSGWNMKKPEAPHTPLYSIPDMEQMLEKDFLAVCQRYNIGKEYYPFVAMLSAMRLVSAGNQMHILDQNTGKELALFHVYSGSATIPHHPQDGS